LPPQRQPQPYKIGVGDVVLLATPVGSSMEQLSGLLAAQNSRQGYTVQDDGSIAIPDVGRVAIAGLTLEEAEATLFQSLVSAQIEPTFSLEISQFNSKKVSIGGAVSTPGVVPITLTPLYLDEALAGVGGTTAANMDYTSVRLYRDGTLYQIPLEALYSNSSLQKIPLLPGDSLFVDDTYQLDQASAYFTQQIQLASYRQSAQAGALAQLQAEVALRRAALDEARSNYQAQANFDATERDYVYLAGEVKKQGRFLLPLGRQASLADALYDAAAGLATQTADPRHVYVLRGSADPMEFDALTAWKLDTTNVANLALATRFELRPNDIVFVAEQPVTRWNRTINQITPSILSISANAVD
jgi:polysaccharide export outer membrane protein